MRQGITLIDGDSVGDTITTIQDNTCCTSRSIQGEDSLDGHIHSRCVEGLKHDLCHLFSVGFGVEGSLCEKDWVFLGSHTELIVEGVMPDLLHVIPVGDNAVLDGVLQGEDTPLALGLVSNIGILLAHADHDTLVPGTADDGGKDSPGSIVTGKPGLAHAGAIVNHKSSSIVVTHLDRGSL